MWYKFSISEYEQDHHSQLKYNLERKQFYTEQIKFLQEAIHRNPDKVQEIEAKIRENSDKLKELDTLKVPYDEKGGEYLYHSSNANPEELSEGLDPDMGSYNDHNTFSGEGYTFFSVYPQFGYGKYLYRVNRQDFHFINDGGEYATSNYIPANRIEYFNGKNWVRL